MGLKECLNKGVPVWAPVDIRFIDLVQVSDDQEKVSKIITDQFEQYMKHLKKFVKSEDIEFFQTMSAVIDSKTLERKVIFSLDGFFSTLVFNLNPDNVCNNYDGEARIAFYGSKSDIVEQLKEIFGERIEKLKNVKTQSELRKEFPLLHRKYREKLKEVKELRQLVLQINKFPKVQRAACIKQLEKDLGGQIPNFSFQGYLNKMNNLNITSFVESYSETFSDLVENADKVLTYISSHPIDFSELTDVDKDKMELYLAGQFLEMAEKVEDDSKQDYLYYISNYFTEHKDLIDSDLAIVVGNNDMTTLKSVLPKLGKGHVLTPRALYDRYCQLLVDNPNLRAIDFSHLDFNGMNADEVKSFMTEYLKDLSANWEFLPPDDKRYEEEVIKKIKGSGESMSEEERQKHQERLLEMFMEKKELYDSSDPFFRVKGKGTFDGYIGFVYPNGRVVLDKFYDDADNGKLADGHAVYAMGIQEFYELSRLSKSEIIRNKLCNRYIHKGNWTERVLQGEIMAETGIDPSVEVKTLIKKGDVTLPESTDNN